jgi:hypothetical protein
MTPTSHIWTASMCDFSRGWICQDDNAQSHYATHVSEMKNMNRNVERNVTLEIIAKAIWEGKAIMGTDGSV